ncbi:MAG: FlgD immunoglobulin-like domain containing protein [Candidatus Kapaibacterium sp.]
MKNLSLPVYILLIAFFAPCAAYAFQQQDSVDIDLMLRREKRPAREVLTDSPDSTLGADDQPVLPGYLDYDFSAQQDSNYYRAMRLNMTPLARLQNDLEAVRPQLELRDKIRSGMPWQIAMQNMENIPSEFLKPTPMEIVQHEIGIIKAFHVPFVSTYNPYGAKISMGAIGQFLGISEDVSPRIRYTLEHPSEVEVVIYSYDATVIRTLFKGQQPAGAYELDWNLRSDEGRRMPSGDYIGEVRIGKSRYVRKRIQIP